MRSDTVVGNLAPETWLMFGESGHSRPGHLRIPRSRLLQAHSRGDRSDGIAVVPRAAMRGIVCRMPALPAGGLYRIENMHELSAGPILVPVLPSADEVSDL